MKSSIILVLCLNTLLAMGQGRTNCLAENPSSGYYLTIQSYEKDTIDGLIDIKVIHTADDTVFMGNLFQLSFVNTTLVTSLF